eukprot:GHVR01178192.1.p1 GENE.GHVR01178192.1~~GHVR01178192.1.p1  ORF type:complete len:414 (+),score=84.05 GHVR01178192.1:34-1242(+)
MEGSLFCDITEGPTDAILGVLAAYKADTFDKKVDLSAGAYRDNDNKPVVFKSVREEEIKTSNDLSVYKEYLPIDGLPGLKPLTQSFIFSDKVDHSRIASAQSVSGTGALRVGVEFAQIYLNFTHGYTSSPTWENHLKIFERAGLKACTYPYWAQETKSLDFKGMYDGIDNAPDGSVILLHAVAHNPTGIDPTKEQWKELLEIFKKRKGKLLAFFDCAYQGYASGDVDVDAYSMRLFYESGVEMLVAQSFAKNLGLYGERMGMLHVVCTTPAQAKNVISRVKLVIRPMYSSPPLHGALLLQGILSDPIKKKTWLDELKVISGRITKVREQLRLAISVRGGGDWRHLCEQIGMFSFTGLTEPQVKVMVEEWHVYMLKNGRISLAGLNDSNIEYVADALVHCAKI